MEVYVDDEAKLTLHGLRQHYIKLKDAEKNRKLFELLDALEFNQESPILLVSRKWLGSKQAKAQLYRLDEILSTSANTFDGFCTSLKSVILFSPQVVIFVKSVQRCVALAQLLIEQNFPAIAIHRGMNQEERLSRYQQFKDFQKVGAKREVLS